MRQCNFWNGLCKENNNHKCYSTVASKCSQLITKCKHCNAEFEEDDFAYALETGLCQYCHKEIYQ